MPDSPSSPGQPQPRWYLVHCKPREDERALTHLERQNYECYRPVMYAERQRAGRRYSAAQPLFPGYLFIRLDCVRDNWSTIRSTRGVHQIVRFNSDPFPVQDEIIEQIRARLLHATVRQPYLKPGERVRITQGAFAQLEAIFVANAGDERVVLLLNLMQTEQSISLPLQSVRRVG